MLLNPGGQADDENIDLVQLCNPWGSCVREGDWSGRSEKWNQQPGIAEKLAPQTVEDGSFWMPAADFSRLFDCNCVMERSMPVTPSQEARQRHGAPRKTAGEPTDNSRRYDAQASGRDH